MVLWGQGEMHLRVALEKLVRKYGIDAADAAAADPLQGDHPQIDRGARPPQEAVRRPRPVRRCRGDHQARGRAASGFEFTDEITGGVVPKNYIPSVEIGVRDYLHSGPLGFKSWTSASA